MILFDFGGMIKGDSKYPKHEDWIQLESAQLNVSRDIEVTEGRSDRKLLAPTFTDVTVSKYADKSSVDLFVEAAGGKKPQKAQLHFCNVTNKGPKVFMTWELTNTVITSYDVHSEGGRPFETVTLNFTQIKVGYTGFKADGKDDKVSPKGWNLETGGKL